MNQGNTGNSRMRRAHNASTGASSSSSTQLHQSQSQRQSQSHPHDPSSTAMTQRADAMRDLGPSSNPSTDYFDQSESQSLVPSLDAFNLSHFFPSNNEFDPVATSTSASTDPNAVSLTYTSPNSTSTASESTNHMQTTGEEASLSSGPAPKRKRENRYRNATPGVLSRRRAQNRASQRAYRERKEQRIRDLELLLEESQQRQETLSQAYLTLQDEYQRLRVEQQQQQQQQQSDSPILPQHHQQQQQQQQQQQHQAAVQPYPQFHHVSGPESSGTMMASLDLELGMPPPPGAQPWRRGS